MRAPRDTELDHPTVKKYRPGLSYRGSRLHKGVSMTAESMSSGVAEVNGARLAYDIVGTGQPLVLLHGHLLDRRQWDDQIVPFAQHYQVIRYDARGFGQSSNPTDAFAHYEDLHGLLTSLGIEHAALMGCSGGGAASIDFALTYPHMTDALVLVGSALSGFPFPNDLPPLLLQLQEAMARNDLDAAIEFGLQLWTDGPRRPEAVNQEARERTRGMMKQLWGRGQSQVESRSADPPAAGRLAELNTPTLAIVGAADNDFIQQIADEIAAQAPRARKVIIDDAGHHPNMEHPQEFNALVLEFLNSVVRGGGRSSCR
jgi:pimeloyl-ACP methyl ester carboxylesterase